MSSSHIKGILSNLSSHFSSHISIYYFESGPWRRWRRPARWSSWERRPRCRRCRWRPSRSCRSTSRPRSSIPTCRRLGGGNSIQSILGQNFLKICEKYSRYRVYGQIGYMVNFLPYFWSHLLIKCIGYMVLLLIWSIFGWFHRGPYIRYLLYKHKFQLVKCTQNWPEYF